MGSERANESWSEGEVRAIVTRHRDRPGALLPVLHELSETFGYLDRRALSIVAEVLNLSEAEVFGVVSFYNDFRTEPTGRTVVRICRAEACQSMGAERIVSHATERLGVGLGGTTPDGAVTLEQVFCLGNCALSPAMAVDGRLVGRVDEARFDELVPSPSSVAP